MRAPGTQKTEQRRQGGHPTVRHAVEVLMLEERTRWAMQIHDGLTQSVTSAVLELQTLRHRIETDPAGAAAALEEVELQIRDDLRRIRELLFDMTNEDPPSAEPALAALVRDLGVRWHFPVMVEVGGDLEGIDEPVLEAVYAIVSEALANAAKHSGAPEAHVRVGQRRRCASRSKTAAGASFRSPTTTRISASGSCEPARKHWAGTWTSNRPRGTAPPWWPSSP